MMIAPGQLLPIIIASHHEKTSRKRSWFPYQWENSASCKVGSSACAATTRIRTGALRSKLRAVLTAPKLAPVCSGPWSREGLSSLWPLKTGSWRKKNQNTKWFLWYIQPPTIFQTWVPCPCWRVKLPPQSWATPTVYPLRRIRSHL